jgi:hypothetical protein
MSHCSSVDIDNSSIYTYFLDNQQTLNHRSFIFGLRELHINETIEYCSNSLIDIDGPPVNDDELHFTDDYRLRLYTSGCYYIDDNGNWQATGLIVRRQEFVRFVDNPCSFSGRLVD